jgi:Asp-tRNA(Asn)/Glu-tRNA(Gln) amidotransferase B subunit
MAGTGASPREVVERRGLEQLSDPDRLQAVVDQVLAAHPAKVEEYRGGKAGLLGFFIGQVMRETGGKANPELAKDLIESRVGG